MASPVPPPSAPAGAQTQAGHQRRSSSTPTPEPAGDPVRERQVPLDHGDPQRRTATESPAASRDQPYQALLNDVTACRRQVDGAGARDSSTTSAMTKPFNDERILTGTWLNQVTPIDLSNDIRNLPKHLIEDPLNPRQVPPQPGTLTSSPAGNVTGGPTATTSFARYPPRRNPNRRKHLGGRLSWPAAAGGERPRRRGRWHGGVRPRFSSRVSDETEPHGWGIQRGKSGEAQTSAIT